jgi:hypothetical protein
MTYNMLRRTKSSSLLPIVRLTNYFYPTTDDVSATTTTVDVYPTRRSVSAAANSPGGREGSLTPPPDYEQLYQAMQLDNFEGLQEERVRKKYACQGPPPPFLLEGVRVLTVRTEIGCECAGGRFFCPVK